jgi:agmatinase
MLKIPLKGMPSSCDKGIFMGRFVQLGGLSSMTYPTWDDVEAKFFFDRKLEFIAPETPTFMGVPHAKTAADLRGADVAIIGSSYVGTRSEVYGGVLRGEWMAASRRVRQQSARYLSSYIVDFDFEVFEKVRVVDFGDAELPDDVLKTQSPAAVLRAQACVEEKVRMVLEAGAIPIVIGQNSPCASYAIAKPIAERTKGNVGCISLDAHWDICKMDWMCPDPRIAGGASWKRKMYEFLPNMTISNLVEIGERGLLEEKSSVREFLKAGAKFVSAWDLRTRLGIDGTVKMLDHAYQGTDGVYVHFDMDVIGGAGPAPGDLLGELAEPIGLSDYEIIRIAHEIGRRGLSGMSFIAIPPGSAVMYRVIVYIIMYLLAGLAMRRGAEPGA